MAIYKDKNKTKDGRYWYFAVYKKDFNGDNKLYKSKKYLTKTEAQQAERIFLMKRDNPINKPFYLVGDAYFDEISKYRKESTIFTYKKAYNKHIREYFGKSNINDLNITNIKIWHEKMQDMGYNVRYLNKLHNILKNIFNYAMVNFGLESNPEEIIGTFKDVNDKVVTDEEKIRYITYEQFNQFISVIDDITWKTFFMLLYYTGMRKGEVQALTWNDIKDNEIIVNKTLSVKTSDDYKITSTKNNLNRKIKMSKSLIEQLTLYKKEMKKYSDFSNKWFVFGCSRFLPQTTIDRYKNHYFKLAGIDPITIHEFRHSHVSLLINEYLKSGQTDAAKFFIMVSSRLGHSIPVMEKTYLHLFPTIQNEIVDILDNL
jgi:integrase